MADNKRPLQKKKKDLRKLMEEIKEQRIEREIRDK
jgi:hypothetical protein